MTLKNSIFALANQKGGVGKTTTAINLSTAFAAIGFKVLLIDVDPQGNATSGAGVSLKKEDKTIYDALLGLCSISEIIHPTPVPNLSLVPANINLAAAEIELHALPAKQNAMKQLLESVRTGYDIVLIDCPPSLGLLTINALTSADGIIIPLQCEYFALEGLAHLINTVNLIKRSLNSRLIIEGILLTMVDKRNNLAAMVESDVRNNFGELVYKTIIPRNVKLSEAPSHGKPALIYDRKCIGSLAYIMLAKEIYEKHLERNNNEHIKRAG